MHLAEHRARDSVALYSRGKERANDRTKATISASCIRSTLKKKRRTLAASSRPARKMSRKFRRALDSPPLYRTSAPCVELLSPSLSPHAATVSSNIQEVQGGLARVCVYAVYTVFRGARLHPTLAAAATVFASYASVFSSFLVAAVFGTRRAMEEVLDDSFLKSKFIPRELPGYLQDFPVIIMHTYICAALSLSACSCTSPPVRLHAHPHAYLLSLRFFNAG